jgi:hypothetical protein
MIRDVMALLRVHQAVYVEGRYGRIWDFDGAEMDGVHAIVVVRTPHGSEVVAGRFYVRPIETDEEFARLREFERLARIDGRWYDDGPPSESRYQRARRVA